MRALPIAGVLLIVAGCGQRERITNSQPPAGGAGWHRTFRDIATEAGVKFRLGHYGKTPLSILETAPGGCAMLPTTTSA